MIRRNRLPLSMFADMTDLEIAFELIQYNRAIWPIDGVDGAITLIDAAEDAVACADAWGGIDEAARGLEVPMALVQAVM